MSKFSWSFQHGGDKPSANKCTKYTPRKHPGRQEKRKRELRVCHGEWRSGSPGRDDFITGLKEVGINCADCLWGKPARINPSQGPTPGVTCGWEEKQRMEQAAESMSRAGDAIKRMWATVRQSSRLVRVLSWLWEMGIIFSFHLPTTVFEVPSWLPCALTGWLTLVGKSPQRKAQQQDFL